MGRSHPLSGVVLVSSNNERKGRLIAADYARKESVVYGLEMPELWGAVSTAGHLPGDGLQDDPARIRTVRAAAPAPAPPGRGPCASPTPPRRAPSATTLPARPPAAAPPWTGRITPEEWNTEPSWVRKYKTDGYVGENHGASTPTHRRYCLNGIDCLLYDNHNRRHEYRDETALLVSVGTVTISAHIPRRPIDIGEARIVRPIGTMLRRFRIWMGG